MFSCGHVDVLSKIAGVERFSKKEKKFTVFAMNCFDKVNFKQSIDDAVCPVLKLHSLHEALCLNCINSYLLLY